MIHSKIGKQKEIRSNRGNERDMQYKGKKEKEKIYGVNYVIQLGIRGDTKILHKMVTEKDDLLYNLLIILHENV